MNTSRIINIRARGSTQGSTLRYRTQIRAFHWNRCVRFSVQTSNPNEHLQLRAVCRPVVNDVVGSFGRCATAKATTSLFPQVYSLLQTCGQSKLNVGLSRSLSTTSAVFEQFQKRINGLQVNAKTVDGSNSSEHGEEVNGASENLPEIDECLSTEQWKALKEEWKLKLGPYYSHDLFESRTMARLCKDLLFQKGRSLIDFVRQEGLPLTYPLMGSYLFLCVKQGDHKELFLVYDWFVANHSVLDDGVLTNLIAGFCQTSRWREGLNFLQDIKQVGIPSARNYQSLINTACDHQEYDLVEELLEDIYDRGTCPTEQTCIKLLQTFHCESEDPAFYDQSSKLVNKLLGYLRAKRFYPSVAVGSELQNWFHRKKGEVWKAAMTRVSMSGKCRSCGSKLDSLDISQEDFLNLQHQITEKVIKGGDIFKKTRPDELEAFMKFADEGCPYDIIVDGLNVAHIRQNKQPSKMLRQFVVYLAQECGLKCLVLGRQHMLHNSKSWNQHHMDAIQDVADCFFTENVSEDDPFMLYATLHSGPKACYVSRDMLRDHKALMDQPTHVSFIKWQRGHQMYPLGFNGGKAVFKDKIVYDTVAQNSNSSWHVPCDDGKPRYSYQVPLDWLCARKVK